MKLCRYQTKTGVSVGLVADDSTLLDLTPAGITTLQQVLEHPDPLGQANQAAKWNLPRVPLSSVKLLPPVEKQEVWASGVTYLRSKTARMEESEFSASAYDKVYAAERPELFFKSVPEKVVGPGEAVGIRKDAKWNVPEPELALVLNSRGQVVGHTIGNDMSSRDIEGENLLYLPQAKVYHRSCALGPWIKLGTPETAAREWKIQIQILRGGKTVFEGETAVGQIKRKFEELSEFLFRSQLFPAGAILLTGTGVVPPDTFTLAPGDLVRIEISGIGTLENQVLAV